MELDKLAYSLLSNFCCSPLQADQCWLLYETAKKEEKNDHPFLLKNVALCSGLSGNWERVHIVCEDAFKSEINAETLESMLTKLIDCAGEEFQRLNFCHRQYSV